MDWLKKVAEHHEDYLEVVKSFGEQFLAEDIVQEMYIKLHKYCTEEKIIRKDGEVNRIYVYFVLRNLFLDYQKEKSKHRKVNIDDMKNIGVSYDYISKNTSFSALVERVEAESETWNWYDTMLFKYYYDSGKSIRQLSKETRISCSSIFQTIKYCKQQLRENVGEDYEDYRNEDYELL